MTPLREATIGHALRTSSNPWRPSSIPASQRDSLRTVGPLTIAVCPSAAKLPLTSSLRAGETGTDPRTPKPHQRTLRPAVATAAACLTATSSLTRARRPHSDSKAVPTKRARGRTRAGPLGASTDYRERCPGTGRATIAARTADFPTSTGGTLRSALRPAPRRHRSSPPIFSKKQKSRRPSPPAPPLCSTRRRHRGHSTNPPKGSRLLITHLCSPGGTRGSEKPADFHTLPPAPPLRTGRCRPTGKPQSPLRPSLRSPDPSQKLWTSSTRS